MLKKVLLLIFLVLFLFVILPFGVLYLRGVDPFELPPEVNRENNLPPLEVERIENQNLEEFVLPNQ